MRGSSLAFEPHSNLVNAFFSREMPLDDAEFRRRLKRYYRLTIYNKPYSGFEDLIADLTAMTEEGEHVITEVDLFYVRRHPYFRTQHDGHMMIVTGVSRETGALRVVDGFYGRHDFAMRDYQACFLDIVGRGRPFYLLSVAQSGAPDTGINKAEALRDLDRSLDNLRQARPDRGLRALEAFVQDFGRFYAANAATDRRPFLIAGFWAFMCNAMNNSRFLTKLEEDMGAVELGPIRDLRAQMLWLNRRWFVLNLAMETALREGDFAATGKMTAILNEILARELETLTLIDGLRDAVAGA